jgi:hypothetical protein
MTVIAPQTQVPEDHINAWGSRDARLHTGKISGHGDSEELLERCLRESEGMRLLVVTQRDTLAFYTCPPIVQGSDHKSIAQRIGKKRQP